MRFLLGDDRGHGRESRGIERAEHFHLLLKVLENYSFYGICRSRDRSRTAQACNKSKGQSAKAAQVIAPAPRTAASYEFISEDVAVPFLVSHEALQLWY